MFSLYISQTKANFPDIMVKKWNGNEFLMAIVFCSYMFIMVYIVMSVMAGIFYSNYKNCLKEIIRGLKNQGYLTRIVSVSLSKYGTIDFGILNSLLSVLNSEEFSPYTFDAKLKAYNVKKHENKLLRLLEKREEKR